jgi:hypothetical protein
MRPSFDVHVDQVAGPVAFIAAHHGGGRAVQPGQPGDLVTGQNSVHCRGVQSQDPGDPGRPEAPLSAQLQDPGLDPVRGS